MLIEKTSPLWEFLGENCQGLILDGEWLLEDAKAHKKDISDHSFLVFPFAKAYEGFLKKLFLELKLIDQAEFYADDVRIGRILNPSFSNDKRSVYSRIPVKHLKDRDLSEFLWETWRAARNLVFHYYPHNFRRLSLGEAQGLISQVVEAMFLAYELLDSSSQGQQEQKERKL